MSFGPLSGLPLACSASTVSEPLMLEADQPGAFGGDLPAFEIEGVAVAFVGRLVELLGDVAVIVEIAKLAVGGNVAPDQILALRVPGRSFGPQAAGIEPLDRGVADLGLEALVVDHDDVGVGIALRLGVAAEVAGQPSRAAAVVRGKRRRALQQGAAIEAWRSAIVFVSEKVSGFVMISSHVFCWEETMPAIRHKAGEAFDETTESLPRIVWTT